MPSPETLVAKVAEAVDRRSFLRKAGTGALGAFTLLFGMPNVAQAYHYCGPYYHQYCCCLCTAPTSCSNCACVWCWYCDYFGTTYKCCECYGNTYTCDGNCSNLWSSCYTRTGI